MITILRPGLAEIGKIKIGRKGREIRPGFRAPEKLDHFVVTTLQRDARGDLQRDEEVHKVIGETPTEIEVMLLYNDPDLVFHTELAYWEGRRCVCRGDGEKASRFVAAPGAKEGGVWTDRACSCELLTQRKCKPHGRLSCALRGATYAGGVHVFRTTSWNTCKFLSESIRFLAATMGGKIAGVPLTLKLMPIDTNTPDGKPTKIYAVGLFFKGDPVRMIEAAIDAESKRAKLMIDLSQVEAKVREEMKALPMLPDDTMQVEPEDTEPAAPVQPISTQAQTLGDVLGEIDIRTGAQGQESTPAQQQDAESPREPAEPVAEAIPPVDVDPIRAAIDAEYARMNYNQAKRTLSLKNMLTKIAPDQATRPISQIDDPNILQAVLDQLQAVGR